MSDQIAPLPWAPGDDRPGPWAVVAIDTGEAAPVCPDSTDPALFDSGAEAAAWVDRALGPDAGKQWAVLPVNEL
jgi:hypothetical protein